ncbi:unnamed protein product [Spirodela intermedia]|uniref:chitinase n=1 Tax=Spirodela intermedia TaxID=51605 RepID=A0A7I8IZT1_SPIIN|nr:unnamed protein product [Spirodela intermedia]CAA6663485.1 unnamed protein product [Spirodela intermedia]
MTFLKLGSLFLSLSLLLNLAATSSAGQSGGGAIAVYWGQNPGEGRLSKACRTGNYDFVNIAFLTAFGGGRSPVLDLSGHCNASRGGCAALSRDIRICQKLGVKVLLSLGGGDAASHSLDSAEDARQVAEYLYNNFLFGKAFSRPLGRAALDGVDFSVAGGSTRKDRLHWEDLAGGLANYSREGRKVLLTAAADCDFPDRTLKRAIAAGVFDAVWVRFFGGATCQYSPENLLPMKLSWERWNAKAKAAALFVGLPAAEDAAAGGGYVPPENFTAQVLPFVSGYPKYGGVMLWDRYYDAANGYSAQVKCEVKDCEVNTDI